MNRRVSLLAVVPVVFALGCDQSSGGAPPAPAPSATTDPAAASAAAASAAAAIASVAASGTSPTKPPPRMGRHGGIAAGLFRATNDLQLTDAQRDGLAKLEPTLNQDDDGIRNAMKGFRGDLLAGIRAGKIDPAKITADDAVIDKAFADHHDKETAALDQLHTLLDPTQRALVVASVRAMQAQREARISDWMKNKDDAGPVDWNKKRLDKMTTDLGLDAGQQTKVAAILAKNPDPPNPAGMQQRWDDTKKRTETLLTAFVGDTFDAKKADLQILPGKTPHEPMDHIVAFFTQLLAVLQPGQLEKLASSMDHPFGVSDTASAPPSPSEAASVAPLHGPVDDIWFPFVEPGEYRDLRGTLH
jgi:Spy/CpxP family protein refolding chaperone